jgi:hypothetical protein
LVRNRLIADDGFRANDALSKRRRRNEKCPGNLLSCQGRLLDQNQDFPH